MGFSQQGTALAGGLRSENKPDLRQISPENGNIAA
jgi:hypothetical protein